MAEESAEIREEGTRDSLVKFAEGLSDWAENGTAPEGAGQELRYCLELQRQRIQEKGLAVESSITPRGPLSDSGGADGEEQDRKKQRRSCSCRCEWRWKRNGKGCYRKRERNTLCVTAADEERIAGFYFQRDYGMDKRELTHRIGKWVWAGMVMGFLCALLPMLVRDRSDYATLLTYPVIGGIVGYAVFTLKLVGGVLSDAVRTIPLMMRTDGTKLQITTIMERFDPGFSYEAFEGRIMTLLKMIFFTEDVRELPVCEQEVLESSFGNIIDTVYRGAMGFRGYHAGKGRCYLELDVYLRDTYDTGRRIYEKNDVIHMTVCKAIQGSPEEDWLVTAVWKN